MADNYANPLAEAETDISKATKAITGLLDPKQEAQPEQQEQQNSPEPTEQESSTEDQPEEQEKMEAESQEEATEEVSQDEEQIETQEKQDPTAEPTYKVKVAGQEYDVTLDELRNGYSRDADYRRKTEELSYEKKQFMSESEKQRQDYSAKLNEANQMLSIAQQQLNQEISSADLEKLYEEDPTEAARIEHRLRKKQEKIKQTNPQSKQSTQCQSMQRKQNLSNSDTKNGTRSLWNKQKTQFCNS